MQISVARDFALPFPDSFDDAVQYLRDVERSLAEVRFIEGLHRDSAHIFANLLVDVPVLGVQRLDFHSLLEAHATGANLIAQPRSGKAWAEVSGQGHVANEAGIVIHYALQIVVHLELPNADKWGGRAFEKMAHATAKNAIERMTLEFGRGVSAGMST